MLLKQDEKMAFGGILCALSALLVLGAGLFPTMTYALPAVSGLLLIAAVLELGKRWAFFCYIAVSLLAFFFGTDKEAAAVFILFFGYYPILKALLDPIRSRPVQWLLKLLIFNAAAAAAFLVSVFLLGVPVESFALAGLSPQWVLAALLLAGNLVFVLYDKAAGGVVLLYCARIRPAMRRIFRK